MWGSYFWEAFQDTKMFFFFFLSLKALCFNKYTTIHFLQQQTLTHKTLSMTRRILLPIDSTGEDVEVLKWVLGNVHRAGDQIVLLHVCVVLYFLVSRSLVSAHSREGERVWQECLRTWKETCGKSKEAFKRYEEVRARGRKRSMVG